MIQSHCKALLCVLTQKYMGINTIDRQMSMIETNIEELIPEDHLYRKLNNLLNWTELTKPLRNLYSKSGRKGYAVESGFKMLFLQFLLDKSDRQMEEYLKYDISAKYFGSFGLRDKTPDHSYFSKFRERIGTHQLSTIFERIVESLKKEKLIREFYTFVDSSKIVACVDSWKARDKALADIKNKETDDDGNPTMNNKNVGKYSSDPEARYGAKGKNNIYIGYKRHVGVDASLGLISKVATTPANIHDGHALSYVKPDVGAVFADKAYSDGKAEKEMQSSGLHSMAIAKNNSKSKNKDKDRFISSLRMPFESVFSKMKKTTRFRGKDKVHFQVLMEAFIFNCKRLIACQIQAIPIAI